MNFGDSVQLTCHVAKGDIPLSIRWLFNGKPIFSHLNVLTSKLGDRSSFLTVPSVTAQHSGDWQCVSRNEAGQYNYTAKLNVLGRNVDVLLGSFVIKLETTSDRYTASVIVACNFHQSVLISLLYAFPLYDFTFNSNSSSYKKLTPEYCIKRNIKTFPLHRLLYSVLPHINPFAFEEEANSGDSVQLTCHASKGDLPLTIRWLHNARPIFSHLGVLTNKIGDRISLLTIPSVSDKHSGDYQCVVDNKAGRVNYTARLYVNGDCVNGFNGFS